MTDSKQRLEDVYEQLEEIKNDLDYPDRDRVMRKLRKERRNLEKALGVEPKNGHTKTTTSRETTKKAVAKASGHSDDTQEVAKKQRRKRKRESVQDGTVADASENYLDSPPEHVIDWFKANGYQDRINNIEDYKGPLYCFFIERKDKDRDPVYLVEKFQERWGADPEFFTYLHQGRITMLALGPVPQRFSH